MALEGYVDLLVILRPHEGRTEELYKVLGQLREASVNELGCVHYRIAQSSSQAPTVFLQERWVDAYALRLHEATRPPPLAFGGDLLPTLLDVTPKLEGHQGSFYAESD